MIGGRISVLCPLSYEDVSFNVVDDFLEHTTFGPVMLLDRELGSGILLSSVLVTTPFKPPQQLRH